MTVMLACMFWPLVWGPTELFLAMLIMAGIKAVLHNVPELRVWAELMSSMEVDIKPQILMAGETPNGVTGLPRTDGTFTADGARRPEGEPK